jgi:hypothetical protein
MSHCIHALRLHQLLLGCLALGYVNHGSGEILRPATGLPYRLSMVHKPANRPVRPHHPKFHVHVSPLSMA